MSDSLILKINNAFHQVFQKKQWSPNKPRAKRELTSKIIGFFQKFGESESYQSYSSITSKGEHVFDVAWYREPSTNNGMYDYDAEHWLEVSIESELGTSFEEIEEDFWKLLIGKAPIKIGIFMPNKKCDVLKLLQKIISNYKHSFEYEKYLIIFLTPVGGGLEISSYIYDYKGDYRSLN